MSGRSAVVAASMLVATTAVALIPAPPAQAHARVVSSSPTTGSIVTSVSTARVAFSETVTGGSDALQVLTSTGRVVSLPARVAGGVVTAAVPSALGAGRYALAYRVVSQDGHAIANALGFSVRLADPTSSPTSLTLSGEQVALSGARVGTRTLRLKGTLRKAIGRVTWRLPGFPVPFEWPLANGKARGMLPFAGTYTVTVTAFSSATSVKTLTGLVRITS